MLINGDQAVLLLFINFLNQEVMTSTLSDLKSQAQNLEVLDYLLNRVSVVHAKI